MKKSYFLIADHSEWGKDQVVSPSWYELIPSVILNEVREYNHQIYTSALSKAKEDGCYNIRLVEQTYKHKKYVAVIGWQKTKEKEIKIKDC